MSGRQTEGRPRAKRIDAGVVVDPLRLTTVDGAKVAIPDPDHTVHLQFRRFAGCPVCNLHLRSFVRRNNELTAAEIREVVLFHSPAEELRVHTEELRLHTAGLPFALVADPDKRWYVAFGVESDRRALADPRAWPAIVQAIGLDLWEILRGRARFPALNPYGGRLGLPADFLIAGDGRVIARKYGGHANDQWSVDEVLSLARSQPVSEGREGP